MTSLIPQFATKTDLPERDPDNYYATPPEPVALMVEMLDMYCSESVYTFLDVGSGNGVWGEALYNLRPHAHITGFEIRPVHPHRVYAEWVQGDATDFSIWPSIPEVVFGNPPYLKSGMVDWVAEIIKRSLVTAFLLRTDWLGSQIRLKKLFQNHLVFVAQSSSRIHFEGRGKNQYREYAFYVWDKRYTDTPSLYWFDHRAGSIHKNFKRDYVWLRSESP